MKDYTFESFVPDAIKAISDGSYQGILKIALKVVNQAKSLSPVNLGQLKGSIMWKSKTAAGERTRGKAIPEQAGEGEILVGTAVEHGIYQEFGTRFMEAQPFFRPAISIVTSGTNGEQAMKEAMTETVRAKLQKVSEAFV